MGSGGRSRIGIIIIILILVVLVGGAVAVFLIGGLLSNAANNTAQNGQPDTSGGGFGPAPQQEQATRTPAPVVQIIIAARDIPRGARLTVQDVSVLTYPAGVPLPASVLLVTDEEGGGLDQVEGRIARVDLLANQPIMDYMLTPGDEPTSLADTGSDSALLIPSGSVAYTMPTTRFGLVGYALRPGDHVDILMSFRFVDVDQEFQTELNNEGIIIDPDPEFPLNQFSYTLGRDQAGPFGSTLLIVPGEDTQRPRQTTQLVIDNAIVLAIGETSLSDIREPIVVVQTAPTPDPAADPNAAPADPNAPPPAGEEPPTPTPTPPLPDIVTLVMDRQDALVLKFALETGASIDVALRSALDDEVNNVNTDAVTLEYIIDFYGVDIPPRLPVSQAPRIDEITPLVLGGFPETAATIDDLLTPDIPPGAEAPP